MNYRHAYHAGNFADVVKHVTLLILLEHLSRKTKPWCYVETHAGRGRYRLVDGAASRSVEWRAGIGRIAGRSDLSGAIARYAALVAGLDGNEDRTLHYPGSPLLALQLMRGDDRAILAELQPDEARALKTVFRNHRQVAVHQTDGYQALKAFLPPNPRRGLVLIDPPYESPDEMASLPAAVTRAATRWPTGIIALWYPMKDRRELQPLMRGLSQAAAGPCLIAELAIAPEDSPARLNGTGMAIIRPPWRLEDTLRSVYPALGALLAEDHPPKVTVGLLDR